MEQHYKIKFFFNFENSNFLKCLFKIFIFFPFEGIKIFFDNFIIINYTYFSFTISNITQYNHLIGFIIL